MENEKTKKCLRCGKTFKPRGSGKLEKKYCSPICKSRQNAKNYYHKMRDDSAFKKKNYDRLLKWIDNNREHFNDLVREPNRIFQQKLRKYRKENNLCPRCGIKLIDNRFICCINCRRKGRHKNG